jgi:serine/threonine-protein kinase
LLQEDEVWRLLANIILTVKHAHKLKIYHRDLKPQNLLVKYIRGKPYLYLIDFGIAKNYHPYAKGALTDIGEHKNTLLWAPPEVIDEVIYPNYELWDAWSIGVIAY